jgi:hypothetical protein
MSSSSSSSLQCNDNNDSVRITKIIVKNIAVSDIIFYLSFLIIYVNGKPHRANTGAEKYIDAVVPITKWTSDTSVLYSVVCNVKASHGNNTDKVTVTVMAYYHLF